MAANLTVSGSQTPRSPRASTSSPDKQEIEAVTSKPLDSKSEEIPLAEGPLVKHPLGDRVYELPPWDGDERSKPRGNILSRIRTYSLQTKANLTRSGTNNLTPNHSLPLRARTTSGRFSGYRGGLLTACIICGSILLVNIILLAWSLANTKGGFPLGVIPSRPSQILRIQTVLHLIINALGTLLLGASNYTMQLLSAPTRAEVDQAHRSGRHLNVGILSFRNLRFGENGILFVFLMASSLPITFFWNSAIFVTDQTQDSHYYGLLVTDQFLQETMVDCTQWVDTWDPAISPSDTYYPQVANVTLNTDIEDPLTYCRVAQEVLDQYHGPKGLIKMDKNDCVDNYRGLVGINPRRNDFLAVTSVPRNQTVLEAWLIQDDSWLCLVDLMGQPLNITNGTDCLDSVSSYVETNVTWNVGYESLPTDYCLVTPPKIVESQLQYSIIIMLVVIACNAVKFICCLLAVFRMSARHPLVTIGDAVASFLDSPDPTTLNLCLLDKHLARNNIQNSPTFGSKSSRWKGRARKHRWYQASPVSRWYSTLLISAISLIVLYWGLAKEFININYAPDMNVVGPNRPMQLDIFPWSANPSAGDFFSNTKFMAMVTFANAPQLLISGLYFLYNGVYSSIACALEWSRLTTARKALRTTETRGLQRSTYWLSLPWKWAFPLSVCSFLMHWLASQSWDYQRLMVYDNFGRITSSEIYDSILTDYAFLNYHVALGALGTFVFLLTIGLGTFRKLPEGLLVGSNSLAISAACHPPVGDGDAAFLPVKWGAVSHETEAGPGHCCFSSQEVEIPKEGGWYQ